MGNLQNIFNHQRATLGSLNYSRVPRNSVVRISRTQETLTARSRSSACQINKAHRPGAEYFIDGLSAGLLNPFLTGQFVSLLV